MVLMPAEREALSLARERAAERERRVREVERVRDCMRILLRYIGVSSEIKLTVTNQYTLLSYDGGNRSISNGHGAVLFHDKLKQHIANALRELDDDVDASLAAAYGDGISEADGRSPRRVKLKDTEESHA